MKRRLPPGAVALLVSLLGCGSGSSAAPTAASSSSLQAQTQAAATPAVSVSTTDVPLSEPMVEAQLLCTTALTYEPCGLVAGSDTVNCFMLCQGQISAGAANLAERGAMDCAAAPRDPSDAGSPSCDFQLREGSPIDPGQLRAACNARCRELQGDAAVTTAGR